MENEVTTTEYSYWTEHLPLEQSQIGSNVFRDLAIQILGDTCIEETHSVAIDGSHVVTSVGYQINPKCANMVISVTWSLFLTCTLLTLGLVRTVFNMFGGRDR